MLPPRATFAWMMALVGMLALAACSGPKYPKCDNDGQCQDRGELCVEGACQQCRVAADCADGQQCAGGRCEAKPECAGPGDCPGNEICKSGKCMTECTANSDCGGNLKCMSSRCVDENACASDSDCPSGSRCEGDTCITLIGRSLTLCTYPSVQFEFNKSNLSADVREGLSQVAECISSAGGTLVVEGHADERGTEEYNLALGDRRARAVVDYLVTLGVPRDKVQVVSKGETEPVDGGKSEAAWAKNRRAEFEPVQ